MGSSSAPPPSSMRAAAEPSPSSTPKGAPVALEPSEPAPAAPSSARAAISAPPACSAAPAIRSPHTPEASSAQAGARSDVASPTLPAADVEALPIPPSARKPPAAAVTERRVEQQARDKAKAEPAPAAVGGIELADVPGLEDLPDEVQAELARQARLATLGAGDQVGAFGAALVLRGSLAIMAVGSEAAGVYAEAGELVSTQGTVDDSVEMRVVAGEDSTLVAVWGPAVLGAAMANCPWVDEELRVVADRYLALAGAATGELGSRFDDSLRFLVTARSRVRSLLPGETIVDAGKPLDGMCVIGAGRIELLQHQGDALNVERVLVPGEFLFPDAVLSGAIAPQAARAGAGGALILVVSTPDVLELVMMVPQLLELLSGS